MLEMKVYVINVDEFMQCDSVYVFLLFWIDVLHELLHGHLLHVYRFKHKTDSRSEQDHETDRGFVADCCKHTPIAWTMECFMEKSFFMH